MASNPMGVPDPTGAAAPDGGGRSRIVDGAIATLRSPKMMALVVGPSLVFVGLVFAAGQASLGLIRGALFFSALLFAAASWEAGELAALKRYARSRGLRYDRGQFMRLYAMPGPPRRLGAYPNGCKGALTGPIGEGPPGTIVVQFPNEMHGRYQTPSSLLPVVCYDLTLLRGELATWSFAVRTVDGRIDCDPPDDDVARHLLSPQLAGWLAQVGGVSFELSGGLLFVIDAGCRPRPSSKGLDRLMESAAHVASYVLEIASRAAEPAPDQAAAPPANHSDPAATAGTPHAGPSPDVLDPDGPQTATSMEDRAEPKTLGWCPSKSSRSGGPIGSPPRVIVSSAARPCKGAVSWRISVPRRVGRVGS